MGTKMHVNRSYCHISINIFIFSFTHNIYICIITRYILYIQSNRKSLAVVGGV